MRVNDACERDLIAGVSLSDAIGRPILYRYLLAEDDVEAITEMLHESYAPLAAAGLHFVASHQDSTVTRERLEQGEAILALDGGRIVGTVSYAVAPGDPLVAFYGRPDVAKFNQFAVRVSHQRCGIGSMLLTLVERRARELGARQLALDTSDQANGLIALYESKGFRFVEYARSPRVNYRSVIMSKSL